MCVVLYYGDSLHPACFGNFNGPPTYGECVRWAIKWPVERNVLRLHMIVVLDVVGGQL